MAKKGIPSLVEQHYEDIQSHILDPQHSPLPEKLRGQFNRVLQIARLLDDYPEDGHIISLMQVKYKVSVTQLRKDIALAKELFKTNHTFDWDFWQAWQIKDQLELIRKARLDGDLKNWNNAKKVLAVLIGQKPEAVDDPRRMEKNAFYIQVNYNGQNNRRCGSRRINELINRGYEKVEKQGTRRLLDGPTKGKRHHSTCRSGGGRGTPLHDTGRSRRTCAQVRP